MPASDPSAPLAASVLIPAYNEEALLGRTLDSVHASFAALSTPVTYEIIVCDNNSTDRTTAVAGARGARVVFEPHNQIAKARNTAAGQARHSWLIFLDADTLLNAALLQATLAAASTGSVCGGGALVELDQAHNGLSSAFFMGCWNRLSATVGLAAGSYVFCRHAAWADVGGFEESVYAGEELFFSRKLKRWGKERRLRFQILTETRVTTSARKMQWYSPWQLLGHVLRMLRPGALRRRAACGLWYERPPQERRS